MLHASRHANVTSQHAINAQYFFHDILVHVDESKASHNALAYAEAMAPNADLTALMYGFMANYPASYYAEAPVDAWLIVQEQAVAEAAQAEERIRKLLAKAGSRADLRRADIMGGEEGATLALQARYADAAVIGWSSAGDAGQQKLLFEGALFDSGRPVLVVPDMFKRRGPPKTILIAWSPTRETTRAVHDAMPLLCGADKVRILVVNTGGRGPETNAGDDIARHLARHDVKVEVKHVPSSGDPVHKVLLEEVGYLGADLLVMGGYSHSRTGEWLFGGVTRDILGRVTAPLLMSH
jgi:nucleotide-binding universal stress UspA family protein